ncbi:sensor domain-containing diguanylate cyclase [Vibrio sp. SCSIO 43136]|uniref:sensor domain-containing diguanylate cyclase n=1 Tax=Vibrio sp. SCSIO 43136 TaxID=2819101 RepID=UPI002075D47F|nr:sensor domain-containing diguanylate cyclase [Vibrio sp. SCSIO 43136]USD64289.1 sensor domain-containing diguanylate cyclase [Vibrio sp. SCSIO 43136]
MSIRQHQKWVNPILTLASTLILTLVTLYSVHQSQTRYTDTLFINLVEQQTQSLQKAIDSDLISIGAGATFFHATSPSNWPRFHIFADDIMKSSDTLVALQWMQKVEPNQIEKHSLKTRQLFPDFKIYTVPKNSGKVLGYHAPNNEPIFVATDIYPRTKENLKVIGLYSYRERTTKLIKGMKDTGQVQVSNKVRLIQDGIGEGIKREGMLVFHPVFDAKEGSDLIGYVIGVIRTTPYFERLISRTVLEQELLLRVSDRGFEAEAAPLLYQSPDWESESGQTISRHVMLPNRNWEIEFKLSHHVQKSAQYSLIAIGLGGLIISLLLSYIVLIQVRSQEHLAHQLASRTQELQYMVDHDSMTGIYNRRFFNKELTQRIKNNEQFALATFDIDHFKSINDNFGHLIGDELLIHVTQIVAEQLSDKDIFARIGGDEFCVISNQTNGAIFEARLDLIRNAVRETPLQIGDQEVLCTLSIGGAIRSDENSESLLHIADMALYRSKESGRDSVSLDY